MSEAVVKGAELKKTVVQKRVGENQLGPSDQKIFKGSDLLRTPDKSHGDNAPRQLDLTALDADTEDEAETLQKKHGKAVALENKIPPLDHSIDSQPSVDLDYGPRLEDPALGCHSGPAKFKGQRNLGFELFYGPNPTEHHSVGLRGLDQIATPGDGNEKQQPGPAAGPQCSSQVKSTGPGTSSGQIQKGMADCGLLQPSPSSTAGPHSKEEIGLGLVL